jgi:hypothetical protein
MFAPTETIFSCVMKAVLARLSFVHDEDAWCQYFSRQYLSLQNTGGLRAVWWCGLQSTFRHGCGPSQQVPEEFNRKVKRDIASLSLRTHQEVHAALEKLVDFWSAPMKPGEELLTGKKFVLTAPMSCLSTERPPAPDAWMLQKGSAVLKQPGGYKHRMPSIVTLLKYMNRTDARGVCPFFQKIETQDGKMFFVMSQKKPTVLPAGFGKKLRTYLRANDEKEVARLLAADGVLERTEHPRAEWRFKLKQYAELWSGHCIILLLPGHRRASCSCWAYCWRGACVHSYAVEEYMEVCKHVPCALPRHAEEVEEASDSEPVPKAKARR